MIVIICNNSTIRAQIESDSIFAAPDGNILDRIIFRNYEGDFIVNSDILDDEKFADIQSLIDWVSNPDHLVLFPPGDPVNDFEDLIVTDDIRYSLVDIDNFGSIAVGFTLQQPNIIKKSNGDLFIAIIYRGGNITITNLQNNTYFYEDTNNLKWWKPVYHANTDTLTFISATSKELKKYDFATQQFTYSVTPGTYPGYGFQERSIGTDDKIYIGTQGDGKVFKYDPVTDVITEFNQLDSTAITIVWELGADSNYIYAILRNNGNYRIVVMNQTTQIITSYKTFADGYRLGSIKLWQDTSTGDKFWECSLLNNSSGLPTYTIQFKDGVEVNLNKDIDIGYITYGEGVVSSHYLSSWDTNFGIDVDLSQIDGAEIIPKLKYKKTTESIFTETNFPELVGEDFGLQVIERDLDNNLLGAFSAYSPVFIWNTVTDVLSEVHGFSPVSTYAVIDFDANTRFLGGYISATYKWDKSQAFSIPTNPSQIIIGVANTLYHRFYGQSGEYLYISQEITRNDYGSAIAIYNNNTGQIINTSVALLATLKDYTAGQIFSINGGNKLVFLGEPNIASKPKIFVWDISSDKDINNTTPYTKELNVTGITGGRIFTYGTDLLIGISRDVLYRIDIQADTVIYRNIPGLLTTARGVIQTDDGKLIFITGTTISFIYEVDPTDLSCKKISSDLGTNQNRQLVYNGSAVYLYGGASSFTNFISDKKGAYLEKLTL